MTSETQEVATQIPVLKVDPVTDAKIWTVDGELHREDGPAIEFADGTKEWYRHGQLHREDGPAIEYASGTKVWYLYGYVHREAGPAYEHVDGTKWWYRHGQLHREDGPAAQYNNGITQWWLNGKEFTKPEWFCELLKNHPLTTRQRELLHALSENWAGNADSLYEKVTNLVPAFQRRE